MIQLPLRKQTGAWSRAAWPLDLAETSPGAPVVETEGPQREGAPQVL